MNHFIKTKAAVTKQSYQHEDDNKKFGVGQGKPSSLLNWLSQRAEAYIDDTDNMDMNQEDQ
eukprot:4735732-Ditylum_brightwellii.AAC.1